jgi:hypothetical protein
MIDVLDRAEQRLHMAHEILTQLQLFERWQVFGTPVLAPPFFFHFTPPAAA